MFLVQPASAPGRYIDKFLSPSPRRRPRVPPCSAATVCSPPAERVVRWQVPITVFLVRTEGAPCLARSRRSLFTSRHSRQPPWLATEVFFYIFFGGFCVCLCRRFLTAFCPDDLDNLVSRQTRRFFFTPAGPTDDAERFGFWRCLHLSRAHTHTRPDSLESYSSPKLRISPLGSLRSRQSKRPHISRVSTGSDSSELQRLPRSRRSHFFLTTRRQISQIYRS